MPALTRRQALALAGSSGLTLFGFTRLVDARAGASARMSPVQTSFWSEALQSRLHYVAYLPADYASGLARYPVVYFLHGLPATATSYLHLAWVADALAQTSRKAILVIPQATRVSGGDPEYYDWGPGENWATALGDELPDAIDATLRTRARRDGRAIVGVSAGGYGASILGLRRPAAFSVVQSWSGYFEPTDPTGREALAIADRDDSTTVAHLVPTLRAQFERYPTRFAFYVGSSDPTFVQANVSLHDTLTSAGVRHYFRLYPGGHSTALWQAHARAWLSHALDFLA
jgi:enterochelin esterase-like enzyme